MNGWEEIDKAISESKHELHLNGEIISRRLINTPSLPEKLFDIHSLNYLEISDTILENLHEEIGRLDNLINLALHRNAINSIPTTINKLEKIKFLDLSFNKISSLPSSLTLPQLHTLNLGNNLLESLPDFSKVRSLGILFIDHNHLMELPAGLENLPNLSEVYASNNKIFVIPETLTFMSSLKNLDLSQNMLQQVSVDLSLCKKMKELNIKDNPLKDNRLRKMTTQCSTKAVLDYISQRFSGDGKKGAKGKKVKNKKKEIVEDDDGGEEHKIYVIQPKDTCVRHVVSHANVKNVRPYICCVLVKDLDLSDPNMFKKFIALQTKLHENECDMRTKATIATHNASTLKFPLKYEAVASDEMEIMPLGEQKKASPVALIDRLKIERDALKLKKKRQPKTGLYRFIDLVDGKDLFACLRNSDDDVISFPPVTNSENTKILSEVGDVFIEVTSLFSLPQCKHVIEELIKQMFQSGLRSASDASKPGLILEKVTVTDEQGNMRVVYPSKVDLDFPTAIPIVRLEQL